MMNTTVLVPAVSMTEDVKLDDSICHVTKDDDRNNNDDDASTSSSCSLSSQSDQRVYRMWLVTSLILFLGLATSGALLVIGVRAAKQEQSNQFKRSGADLVKKVEGAWKDYVTAAAFIHGRCRSGGFTRREFREHYEYLIACGLEFQAAQFDPYIPHDEREAAEAEARAFYAEHHPHVNYRGFVGLETEQSETLEPRSRQDFYVPIHFMEPIPGNEAAIGLDYHASGSRRRTVQACMTTGKPALTDRLRLVQETDAVSYGVVLMHPGINITTQQDAWPRDLASIVIRIPDLLKRSAENQGESSAAYIFDSSDPDSAEGPRFLGGVRIEPRPEGEAELTFLDEISISDVRGGSRHIWQQTVPAANKEWTVVVLSLEGTFEPDLSFVLIGGAIIFVASVFIALWVRNDAHRIARYNHMKATANAEKAALILDNARQATAAERELNDFIAHEVRNPVAAAMSACSFVKTAINEEHPLRDVASRQAAREDMDIIDNALRFVNDLLRNMLDMHRASNKQLVVNMTPTDVLHDVLEPVCSMLYQRNSKVEVILECKPKNLAVMTDRLRLKQIILNLGRNSAKFVDRGFVKLRAEEIDGLVQLSVDDSGPGIPKGKRDRLFCKFQESLDTLSQGTGIGLFLCKNLAELMDGNIFLDETYDSGVAGCPGTRFVVDLKVPRVEITSSSLEEVSTVDVVSGKDSDTGDTYPMSTDEEEVEPEPQELPDILNVLFVDDDAILRKLFSRSLRKVAPRWNIREAANGETALRLTEADRFDLIFMDMYMASVEKQMLGSEAVKALRSRGIQCRICGLSANDKETEFLEAGADVFIFKPIPCESNALKRELCRILYHRDEKSA